MKWYGEEGQYSFNSCITVNLHNFFQFDVNHYQNKKFGRNKRGQQTAVNNSTQIIISPYIIIRQLKNRHQHDV